MSEPEEEGSGISVIVVSVIAIIFIIMGAVYITEKFKPASERTEWKTACSTSIEAHLRLFSLGDAPPIICPTQELIIDENLGKSSGLLEAEKQIDRLVKDCAEVFGSNFDKFGSGNTFCHICGVVKFEGSGEKFNYNGAELNTGRNLLVVYRAGSSVQSGTFVIEQSQEGLNSLDCSEFPVLVTEN